MESTLLANIPRLFQLDTGNPAAITADAGESPATSFLGMMHELPGEIPQILTLMREQIPEAHLYLLSQANALVPTPLPLA